MATDGGDDAGGAEGLGQIAGVKLEWGKSFPLIGAATRTSQPFGYRAVDRAGHRFARKSCKLLSPPVGFFVLDVQAHGLR